MKFCLVIAAYNSEKSIKTVVMSACKALRQIYIENDFSIIVVDDCSRDATWDVLEHLKKEVKNLTIVQLSRNFGQQQAMMAGFSFCRSELVGYCDDDGQSPVDRISSLIEALHSRKNHVVWAGYRDRNQLNFLSLGRALNEYMLRIVFGKSKSLEFGNMWVSKKFVIDELIKSKTPSIYIGGALLSITHNMSNVYLVKGKRLYGTSGYTLKKLTKIFLNGLIFSSITPLRLASVCGIIFATLGFSAASLTIVFKLGGFDFPAGYASVIATILIIGGVQLLILGLMGEYLGRVYLSVAGRPQFVISRMG